MVHEALIEPVVTVWQTPAIPLPACKTMNKNYDVPAKESEFLFSLKIENRLEEHHEECKAIVKEGQWLAKTSLQAFLGSAA